MFLRLKLYVVFLLAKIAEKIAHKRVFLTFLSLILIQTFALAQNDSKITIQQKNITVIDALKTVEKQSKKSINYSDSELKGKVIAQLNLRNASLETALDTILKGTGFSFQIQGNYIIIAEKKPVVAQTLKNIKGKVTDESGEPLIGVNISVDGSSTGTITDFDGNFTIKAAEKSILKVSYIGYAAQIIPVSKKDFYPVVMKQDTEVLDEVVVTALGIKRAEKALSYNVQQVKGDALTTVPPHTGEHTAQNAAVGFFAGAIIHKGGEQAQQNAAEHAGVHSLDAQHHGLACAVQAGKRIRLRQQAQLGQRYIARCQVDKIAHQGDERRLMLFPLCQRRRKTGAEQHAQI